MGVGRCGGEDFGGEEWLRVCGLRFGGRVGRFDWFRMRRVPKGCFGVSLASSSFSTRPSRQWRARRLKSWLTRFFEMSFAYTFFPRHDQLTGSVYRWNRKACQLSFFSCLFHGSSLA